jgi:hypothetical protein
MTKEFCAYFRRCGQYATHTRGKLQVCDVCDKQTHTLRKVAPGLYRFVYRGEVYFVTRHPVGGWIGRHESKKFAFTDPLPTRKAVVDGLVRAIDADAKDTG